MAKAKVKIKVPTVDLIAPSKVPQTASARSSLMGSAVNMMPSSVPGTLKMGALPLSQEITQQEMMNASAALGPTQVNGQKIGGTVESVGNKRIAKVKTKKK